MNRPQGRSLFLSRVYLKRCQYAGVSSGVLWTAWIWSRRMGAHICGSPSGIKWSANGSGDLIPFPSNLIRWPASLAHLFLLSSVDVILRRLSVVFWTSSVFLASWWSWPLLKPNNLSKSKHWVATCLASWAF